MIGRIRYKVAGYQCVSEWPSVISHISRYEPRDASGTATATLIPFSWAAILSIPGALEHDVLEKFRPFLGLVERADGVGWRKSPRFRAAGRVRLILGQRGTIRRFVNKPG